MESNFSDILVKLATDWKQKYEELFHNRVENIAQTKKYPFKFMFKGKDRIVMPFKNPSVPQNENDEEIINTLVSGGYSVDWKKGLASKDSRTLKIVRALREIFKQNLSSQSVQMHLDKMIHNYEASVSRAFLRAQPELFIVISQNPHDMARMSYGRNWDSCMNLEKGEYAPKYDDTQEERESNVFCEVQQGGLIAYITTKKDIDTLEKPAARILLRRFQNNIGESILVPESRIYGIPFSNFVAQVNTWIKDNKLDTPSKQLSLFFSPIYTRKGVPHSDTLKDYLVPNTYFEDLTYNKVMSLTPEERESLITTVIEKNPNHDVIEEVVENTNDPNLLYLIATLIGEAYAPLFLLNENFWNAGIKFVSSRFLIVTAINRQFLLDFFEREQSGAVLIPLINRILTEYGPHNSQLLEEIAKKAPKISSHLLQDMAWNELSDAQLKYIQNKTPSSALKQVLSRFIQ